MTPGDLPAWGPLRLSLALPGLTATVSGLSAGQHAQLQAHYAAFVDNDRAGHPPGQDTTVHLRAARHDHFRAPRAVKLTRDGQYTPQKHARRDGGFDLTGVNFSARLYPAGNKTSVIGVARETELAQANVIENVLRVLVAYSALRQGGAMLHSAGIVCDGRAWIFCGRSNAGKTTLTRKAHAAGLDILSDDINLLLPARAGFCAHAVPFTGEFGSTLENALSGAYPVAGLVLLRQGAPLSLEPVSAASATAALLAGCPFVNDDEHETDALLDTLSSLGNEVPVGQLTSALADDIGAIMALVQREQGQLSVNVQAQAL